MLLAGQTATRLIKQSDKMNPLLIHFSAGLAVYPVSLLYWYLYWYIQPSDPNSLKLGFDVTTGQPLPKKAARMQYIGFVGACIIAAAWGFIGNYYAKSYIPIETGLLGVFHWSEFSIHEYLYFWFFIVVGLISLAWYTAKVLVSRKKWKNDSRRFY